MSNAVLKTFIQPSKPSEPATYSVLGVIHNANTRATEGELQIIRGKEVEAQIQTIETAKKYGILNGATATLALVAIALLCKKLWDRHALRKFLSHGIVKR